MSDVKSIVFIIPAHAELDYLHSLDPLDGWYLDEVLTFAIGFLEVEYDCAAADILYEELYSYAYAMTGDGLSDLELEVDYVARARHNEATGMANYALQRITHAGQLIKPLLIKVLGEQFFENHTLAAAYIVGGDIALKYDQYAESVPAEAGWLRRT